MSVLVLVFLAIILLRLATAKVTSIAFLFSVMTLLLYVIPYITLWSTFEKMGFVSLKYFDSFFSFLILCYLGFVLGDYLAATKPKEKRLDFTVDLKKFESYAIIAGIIGIGGYGYFIIRSGAGYFAGHLSGDFSVGGYIYELRYFIFSSVLLLFNLFLNRTITKKGLIFLAVCCIFLTFDAYIQQQRGSWIRFGIIFIFSYLFAQKDSYNLRLRQLISKYKVIFLSGVFLGFLLVFTVQIRKFYSPTSTFTEQVSKTMDAIMENPDLLFGGSGIDEGNEFVTAFNGFVAHQTSGHYDWGLKWLYPFMNFVPRSIWENKPYWHTFSIQIFEEIDRYSLIKSAYGSAETGVIDTLFRFSWLSPVFFLAFGYYTNKLLIASERDIRFRFFYICMYVGTFYFITQNMMPFIIFTLYMYIPIAFITKTCFKKVR